MNRNLRTASSFILVAASLGLSACASAGVLTYGDKDLLGFGYGAADPTLGTTQMGLLPGVSSVGPSFTHGFPFTVGAGDYPGTDQIYVGSNQTGSSDGYSSAANRVAGPMTFALNAASLVPAGQTVSTLTLGISADDFQPLAIGNPFTVKVNGVVNTALTAYINRLNETGPLTQYFTMGLDPSLLTSTGVLNLSIDEGGSGGDGWAVDFLTVGITTTPTATPEPSALAALGLGAAAMLRRRKRA